MKNVLKFMLLIAFSISLVGCFEQTTPVSASGVKKTTAKVKLQANGLTIEQEAVKNRQELENMPGSVKHLYVLSAYSGKPIIYSTVKGKVTSSKKRLTPSTVSTNAVTTNSYGFSVQIGNEWYYTKEVLGDDGTYGSSAEYLYWTDTKGIYHQHYVSGGQIVHVSDQPIQTSGVILTID